MAGWLISSCKIGFSFSESIIDYSKVSTIAIKDFPNIAPYVYAPLSQQFAEMLKDKYTRQTKLRVLSNGGGDLELEGEITGHDITSLTVTDGLYASQTRVTISIRVRFTNKSNPEDDFERTFSAKDEFSNEQTIDQVQNELYEGIMKEIIDLIFNETVGKW